VNRSLGPFALLLLAILSIVAVVAVTRPVRVETNGHSKGEATAVAPAESDAGALDSLLDGVRIEHQLKHGR
jgi:hypothetical protein